MSRDRTKEVQPSSAAIARVMRENGLPVPAHLDEMMSADIEASHAERSRATMGEIEVEPGVWAKPDRRATLLELGWPRRAIEYAEKAIDTEAIRAMRSWQDHHDGIVLAGSKGCGKTVAAAWFALSTPACSTVRFIRAATLNRTSNFEDGFGDIVSWPALCIDDLGAEYVDAKGWFVSNLDELIDTFYANRRPLIITTNLDGKTFAERYGARVRDRVTECCTWAPIASSSLRTNDEPAPWETR